MAAAAVMRTHDVGDVGTITGVAGAGRGAVETARSEAPQPGVRMPRLGARAPLRMPVKLRGPEAREAIEVLLRLADDDEPLAVLAMAEHIVHRYRGGRKRSFGGEYTSTDELLYDAQSRGASLQRDAGGSRVAARGSPPHGAGDESAAALQGERARPPPTAPPAVQVPGSATHGSRARQPLVRPPRLVLPDTPGGANTSVAHTPAPGTAGGAMSRRGEGMGGGNRLALPTVSSLGTPGGSTPQGPHGQSSHARTPRHPATTAAGGPLTHRRAPPSSRGGAPWQQDSFGAAKSSPPSVMNPNVWPDPNAPVSPKDTRSKEEQEQHASRVLVQWLRDKERRERREQKRKDVSKVKGVSEFAATMKEINKRRHETNKHYETQKALNLRFRDAFAAARETLSSRDLRKRDRILTEVGELHAAFNTNPNDHRTLRAINTHMKQAGIPIGQTPLPGTPHSEQADGSYPESKPNTASPSSRPPPPKTTRLE